MMFETETYERRGSGALFVVDEVIRRCVMLLLAGAVIRTGVGGAV